MTMVAQDMSRSRRLRRRSFSACRLFAFAVLAAFAADARSASLTYRDWKTSVSDGSFSDGANWSGGGVPLGEDDVTRFFTTASTAGADCRIRFAGDVDSRTLALGVQLYTPSRFILDLSDASYRMVATETARGRDGCWYPFFVLVNRPSTDYALRMTYLSDGVKSDPVLAFEECVLALDSRTTGQMAFSLTGGQVDFAPGWERLGRAACSLDVDNDASVEAFEMRLEGSAVRTPSVKWHGLSAGSRLVVTNGASLRLCGDLTLARGHWLVADASSCVCPARKVSIATTGMAKVEVNGGYWGPEDPSVSDAYTTLVIGEAGGVGEVALNGGEIRLAATDSTDTQAICRLGPGTAAFVLNDGSFTCGDLYIGYSGGAADAVQSFAQNGGTATVSRVYLGVSRTDTLRFQHPQVSLNGGVLAAKQIFVHADSSEAFKENARFSANGGTLRAVANQKDWFYGFRHAELGAKGLTVDTQTWNPTLAQPLTNATGEEGLLVKCGKGTLCLSSASYDVARTVITEGTLAFDADKTLATELILTNGAAVSLVGDAVKQLTVDALTVADGTLRLDPGDMIHVRSDRVDVTGLKVAFSSAVAEGDVRSVLTFDGDVTTNARVRTAMRRLALQQAVATGRHAAFGLSYDAASDRTTLSASVRPDAEALSEKTVWQGPTWTDGASWSAGIPTATVLAAFERADAPLSVAVPEGAEVGALALAAGDLVFTGADELFLRGEKGAVRLDVLAGHPRFELPLAAAYSVPMTLAEGTSLDLAAGFRDGGLEKAGLGQLILSGASTFVQPVAIGGGLNVVRHERALGTAASQVRVMSDTMAFAHPDGQAMQIPARVRLDSTATPSNAIVVKAESDVAFEDFGVKSGVLVKRGAGRMAVIASASEQTVLSVGHGTAKSPNGTLSAATTRMAFSADGQAPTLAAEYAGLNIAEGELAIVGTSASQTVRANGSVLVGMDVAEETTAPAQPKLTVDGASFSCLTGSGHMLLGFRAGADGSLATQPELKILNGGSVMVPTLRVGTSCGFAGAFPSVTVTNAALLCVNAVQLSNVTGAKPSACAAVWRAKDATVATTATASQWGHQLYGAIDAVFENVYWGGQNAPANFTWNSDACGRISLRGGTFAMAAIVPAAASNRLKADLTLSFDDTLWAWGDGDLTLTAETFLPASLGHLEMRGTGLRVAPAAGRTLTVAYPLTGDGGFVLEGAGTVAFAAPEALSFTGLLDIRAGTVDLSDAGKIPALALQGPGTLRGGNITALTVKAGLDGAAVPTLAGVSVGCARIDLGHGEDDPLDPASLAGLTVARLADGASVRRWKLVGTGVPRLSGRFVVEGNRVILKEAGVFGLAVIVR